MMDANTIRGAAERGIHAPSLPTPKPEYGTPLPNPKLSLPSPEQALSASRWLLFPISAGLVLALMVYVGKFLVDDFHMVMRSFDSDTEELRVLVLGLVDTAMVANLLVMIIQGSHQIFVRKFRDPDHERPQWLDHIDSGLLKLKVSLSIAGITLVQILKDFVDVERLDWTVAMHRMEIHAMCLLSALVMAVIWRVTHSPDSGHPAEEKHT